MRRQRAGFPVAVRQSVDFLRELVGVCDDGRGRADTAQQRQDNCRGEKEVLQFRYFLLPSLGLCHNTLTTARTPKLGLSQHTDTSKNAKAWAVSQHTDTSKNTVTTQ